MNSFKDTMSSKHADCLIIGGGIIGMLTALELAKTGIKVMLFDKQHCGMESTWAGGGIVSPLYPWRYNDAVSRLSHWAQQYYPGFSRELYKKTGIDPEYEDCGLLMFNIQDEESALTWASQFKQTIQVWQPQHIYKHQANLGKGFSSGLWCPYVGHIRPPRLRRALLAQMDQDNHITLMQQTPVQRIVMQGQQVKGVQLTDGQHIECPMVVLCAGAWSNELLGSSGLKCNIEPVRGQMLMFAQSSVRLTSMILNNGHYLIPRRDGRILVGSTLEYTGFHKTVTENAYDTLLSAATQLVPALGDVAIEAHWAGLRPGTSDGTPLIGRILDIKGLYINAGHFRNGLVLAPASARLLSDIINDKPPVIDQTLYCPNNRIKQLHAE